MWIFKRKDSNESKEHFGIPFLNGVTVIHKWSDFRFLSTRSEFINITPKSVKNNTRKLNKVLIKVPGGIGDSIFAIPFMEALVEKHGKDIQIHVCGLKYSLDVLKYNPRISKFIFIPNMYLSWIEKEYDDIFDLGCTIEGNPEAEFANAYKVTSDTFNLKPNNYNPTIWTSSDETLNAKKYLNDMNIPFDAFKIGVHLESTSNLRTFPKAKINSLLNELSKLGYVLFFTTKHIDLDDINNNIRQIVQTPLRTTIGLINEMNLMVCIDSGLLHISAGLNKPIIALFSNFDGALRTSYFKNCITINTKYRCAPCHLNNVPRCTPMIRDNLIEPPCVNEFKIDEIIKYALFIKDKNGEPFESVHVNKPSPVQFDRKQCIVCNSNKFNLIARKVNFAYTKCLKCESIFALSESPKDAYLDNDYHSVFENEFIQDENIQFGKRLGNQISSLLKTSNGNRIMEIGCSNGTTLKGFYDVDWIPYGIEISSKVIETIEYPWKKNILNGDLYEVLKNGKAEWQWPGRSPIKISDDGIELKLGGFECVLMQHSLEHFNEPLKAFKAALSLLAPDGYLVITGPTASFMSLHGASKNPHLNTLIPGEHQSILSKKAFLRIAKKFKLEIIKYNEDNETHNMFSILKRG